MKEYCAKLGTFQQRSTRGTPQQNARAERPNRWIIEGANAALLDANLHISFWGYAVVMKVWLKNRSPHAKLHKQTPFERWTGSKPDLSKLHVFGTTGYAHIPKDFRKKAKGVPPKFINHAKPMIFVAYSEVVKGYTMFDPDTRTELDCSEVTFPDESSKYVERDLRLTTNASVDTESTLLDHMVSNEFIETIIDDEEEIAVPANGTIHPKVPVNGTAQTDSDNESQIEESEPKPSSDNEHETDTLDQYQNDSSEDEITNYGHSYLIEQAMNGYSVDFDYENWAAALLIISSNDSPSYHEAMNGPCKQDFKEAIASEYASLEKNKVFSKPMNLPTGFKAIDTKLVLKIILT